MTAAGTEVGVYSPAGRTSTVNEMWSAMRGSQGTATGEMLIMALLPGTSRSSLLRASAGLRPLICARSAFVETFGLTNLTTVPASVTSPFAFAPVAFHVTWIESFVRC